MSIATVLTLTQDATIARLAARMDDDPLFNEVVHRDMDMSWQDVHFIAREQLHIWAAIHGITFDDLRGRLQAVRS